MLKIPLALRSTRTAPLLAAAGIFMCSLSACYASAQPPGSYYVTSGHRGYYPQRYYYNRNYGRRHHHYRARDPYRHGRAYRQHFYNRHHHHPRPHHHRHHSRHW